MNATEHFRLRADGAQASQAIAATLAHQCKRGDCILLRGEVGAGKTTFARGFIQALCADAQDIVSPTFTIAQTYQADNGEALWHFDFYRLKAAEDVGEIGLDEAMEQGISLIEWPELLDGRWPDSVLDIHIDIGADSGERIITLTCVPALWQSRLTHLQQHHDQCET